MTLHRWWDCLAHLGISVQRNHTELNRCVKLAGNTVSELHSKQRKGRHTKSEGGRSFMNETSALCDSEGKDTSLLRAKRSRISRLSCFTCLGASAFSSTVASSSLP